MFRIVCFVDDRKLPNVLHALANLVVNMEPPQPVVNAVAKNGKLEQISSSSSKRGRLIERLSTMKGSDVSKKQLSLFMVEAGGSPRSLTTDALKPLLDQKILKRKARGLYHVL